MNQEEVIQVRLDTLTGGMNAMVALLMALIETHPDPQKLQDVLSVFTERTVANQLAGPLDDAVSESTKVLHSQFLEQLQLRSGISS